MNRRSEGAITRRRDGTGRTAAPRRRPPSIARPRGRRGVASVLSMMFMIIFGTLAVAMAIASQGNLQTSATHLHVVRAMGAAETGLRVAEDRLRHAVSRFVVERGRVDALLGERLWAGTFTPADGAIDALPLPDGTVPGGIADALVALHNLDENIIVVGSLSMAQTITAPPEADWNVYRTELWVATPAIAMESQPGAPKTAAADAFGAGFQITYAPLKNGTHVRAIVTGYDFNYSTGSGQPLTRTVMQDFRVVKRVNQAVVSPSRIMIGKNVLVTGDLGASYQDVDYEYGRPLTVRSDFTGLSPELDARLQMLQALIAKNDVDFDNRLRVNHPVEGQEVSVDPDGDGQVDYSFSDVTGDGYIDEFDEFIRFYDKNGDGKVALSDALRAGTPNAGLSPEFVDENGQPIDDDLALLIDSSNPDRNRNGVYGFFDENGNGRWDEGEIMLDYDQLTGDYADQVLGYRDGVIDKKDRYTKVRGKLVFRTSYDAWTSKHGPLSGQVIGPVTPAAGQNPYTFDAGEEELPDLTAANFTGTQEDLKGALSGALSFNAQVAAQLGVSEGALGTYVEEDPLGTGPQFYRLDPDLDGDGEPDNAATAYFEKMPFNSPNFSDWYYRPVYKNMVFKDAEIPVGTNALFVNCTFVGVTHVRTHTGNTHVNWPLYGRMTWDNAAGRPVPACPRAPFENAAQYPDDVLPATALPPNQDLLLPVDPSNTALDKADFPKNTRPLNFNLLPAPLIINGKRVTDTKLHSNNIRFHDCLFIGSIISDTPEGYTQSRNKLQFTGATRFVRQHPDPYLADEPQYMPDEADLEAIAKSTMMLPNYSVDIGSFNSPQAQDVRLSGAIIAGVLDIRGNATIHGALLLTFKPVLGQLPLVDTLGSPVGNPAGFNTTIGYFGPEDGDDESLDPELLPYVDGVRIVGWDTNGDGLADVGPDQAQPPNSVPVPFHGYGRIELRFDPELIMPDGVMLPLQLDVDVSSYREGRL